MLISLLSLQLKAAAVEVKNGDSGNEITMSKSTSEHITSMTNGNSGTTGIEGIAEMNIISGVTGVTAEQTTGSSHGSIEPITGPQLSDSIYSVAMQPDHELTSKRDEHNESKDSGMIDDEERYRLIQMSLNMRKSIAEFSQG